MGGEGYVDVKVGWVDGELYCLGEFERVLSEGEGYTVCRWSR